MNVRLFYTELAHNARWPDLLAASLQETAQKALAIYPGDEWEFLVWGGLGGVG